MQPSIQAGLRFVKGVVDFLRKGIIGMDPPKTIHRPPSSRSRHIPSSYFDGDGAIVTGDAVPGSGPQTQCIAFGNPTWHFSLWANSMGVAFGVPPLGGSEQPGHPFLSRACGVRYFALVSPCPCLPGARPPRARCPRHDTPLTMLLVKSDKRPKPAHFGRAPSTLRPDEPLFLYRMALGLSGTLFRNSLDSPQRAMVYRVRPLGRRPAVERHRLSEGSEAWAMGRIDSVGRHARQ
jgi:hypothetical protein